MIIVTNGVTVVKSLDGSQRALPHLVGKDATSRKTQFEVGGTTALPNWAVSMGRWKSTPNSGRSVVPSRLKPVDLRCSKFEAQRLTWRKCAVVCTSLSISVVHEFEQLNGHSDINAPLAAGPKMRATLDDVIGLHEVVVMIRSMPQGHVR